MQRTVKEHLDWIQQQIAELEAEIGKSTDQLAIHYLKADIRSLNLALNHYKLALQIEADIVEARRERKMA
jgi:hypothetical protein